MAAIAGRSVTVTVTSSPWANICSRQCLTNPAVITLDELRRGSNIDPGVKLEDGPGFRVSIGVDCGGVMERGVLCLAGKWEVKRRVTQGSIPDSNGVLTCRNARRRFCH